MSLLPLLVDQSGVPRGAGLVWVYRGLLWLRHIEQRLWWERRGRKECSMSPALRLRACKVPHEKRDGRLVLIKDLTNGSSIIIY